MAVAQRAQAEIPVLVDAGPSGHEDFGSDDIYAWLIHAADLGLAQFTPEVRLRVGLLAEAMDTMRESGRRDDGTYDVEVRREYIRARKWIDGELPKGYEWTPGTSFEDCCDVIFTEIDHGTVRKAVRATIERGDFNIRDLVFWLR
jgi:hypothetical protein